jgi:hypothetical protein
LNAVMMMMVLIVFCLLTFPAAQQQDALFVT